MRDALPFKIEDVYCKLIPLTRGQWTIVWESDFELLSQWKWWAWWSATSRSFYAIRHFTMLNGKIGSISMQRQILGLESDDITLGDHENHVTLDNRRSNLRIATTTESSRNQRIRSDNTSGYKNVYYHKARSKWVAYIRVDGTMKYLGIFISKEEAYAAYCAAARLYFGEFACLK
jgi:hypothetical protein